MPPAAAKRAPQAALERPKERPALGRWSGRLAQVVDFVHRDPSNLDLRLHESVQHPSNDD
jgi:hypothetical protein